MTDVGWLMLQTRMLNDYLGSSYRIEDVEVMDPLLFVILQAQRQGLEPTPGQKEEVPDGRE